MTRDDKYFTYMKTCYLWEKKNEFSWLWH